MLNAVIDERYQDALAEAREVDQRVANGLSIADYNHQPFLGKTGGGRRFHQRT